MPETLISKQKRKVFFPSPSVKTWRLVLLTSCLTVLTYQGIAHLNPNNMDWIKDGSFRWVNFLQFILLDQILIETITVIVIMIGLKWYSQWKQLQTVSLNTSSILSYLLKFLPLLLIIYLAFAPITTTIRFGLHYFPNYDRTVYFSDYFFLNTTIYLSYLLPTFFIGFILLFRSILLGVPTTEVLAKENRPIKLLVKNQEGEQYLSTDEIQIIYREHRKNWILTNNQELWVTTQPLSALEDLLPAAHFIRINRATILPIQIIHSFTFWENQKYILKTKRGKAFVVSRDRMKLIKAQLAVSSSP